MAVVCILPPFRLLSFRKTHPYIIAHNGLNGKFTSIINCYSNICVRARKPNDIFAYGNSINAVYNCSTSILMLENIVCFHAKVFTVKRMLMHGKNCKWKWNLLRIHDTDNSLCGFNTTYRNINTRHTFPFTLE